MLIFMCDFRAWPDVLQPFLGGWLQPRRGKLGSAVHRRLLSVDITDTNQRPLRAVAFVSLVVGPACLVTPPSLVKEICLRSAFKARPPPLSCELEY